MIDWNEMKEETYELARYAEKIIEDIEEKLHEKEKDAFAGIEERDKTINSLRQDIVALTEQKKSLENKMNNIRSVVLDLTETDMREEG